MKPRPTRMKPAKVISLTLALLCSGPLFAMASPSPGSFVKQKNAEVDKLLRQKAPAGSAAEKKQQDEMRSLAASLLDYQELSRRSLGEHWDKLTRAQQNEFVRTLRELIERNYLKQLKNNLDYQVEYKGEEIAGDEATVNTIIKVKTEGKMSDLEIDYKLKKSGEGWQVFDVITDDVSLIRNYKSQFHKIITEKSYEELIRKMKGKLAEGS